MSSVCKSCKAGKACGQKKCARNAGRKLLLENLPTDVLIVIFWYCDDVSLGRLCQQCRRFNEIISDDFIWTERSREALVTNQLSKEIQNRSLCILSLREKCRISANWKRGKFKEVIYFQNKTRYMPWLSLNRNSIWVSRGSVILSYQRKRDGIYCHYPVQRLTAHLDDVCRFVEVEDTILSGGRDGSLCGWNCDTGKLVLYHRNSHSSDVNAVSFMDGTLVSGSRDKTVKFWRWRDRSCDALQTINVQDGVWCTSLSPQGNMCAVGSSGYHQIPPLHLYDIEQAQEIMHFKGRYVAGAGILDTLWESAHLLCSAGYDGCMRLWDCRTGCNVQCWEDPFDSAIYCLASDKFYTIMCGTSQHGRVQLWDKRQRNSVQMYFMSANHSSPVYSLVFDPCHLIVALDQSVNVMDFSGMKNCTLDVMPHFLQTK